MGPRPFDEEVRTRIWIISDLQSADPEEVRRCLETAIGDVTSQGAPIDRIWYLGDGVTGTDIDRNRTVADIQVELLGKLDVPLRYVMGNHDLDYTKKTGEVILPLYDAVSDRPDWRTTDSPDDFYFIEDLDSHTVLFLSDHVDPDGRWSVTHGEIHGECDRYPHTASRYRTAVEEAQKRGKPILVAGHTAFPGGNRPSALHRRFLPLPDEVHVHFYGHAHIGDERYAGRNAYRTISYVDDHNVPQVNVSSLEDRRGDTIRSAVLEIDSEGRSGVYIRDHGNRSWLEGYQIYGNAGRYITRVQSDGTVSTPFSSSTQNQQMAAVVDHLVSEYDLGRRVSIPYSDERSRVLLNDEPIDAAGKSMRQPYELSDGTYLERNFDKAVKKHSMAELAAACGVELEFDGLW